MKQLIGVILLLVMSACQPFNESETQPPEVNLSTKERTALTTLGSYCWHKAKHAAGCVDTVGPKDLVNEQQPFQVKPHEKITFTLSDGSLPEEVELIQYDETTEDILSLDVLQMNAPAEKGYSIFSLELRWKENGGWNDASYAFSLEVQ